MGGRGASSGNNFDPLRVPNKLKEHYDKIKDRPIEELRTELNKANDNFNKIPNAEQVYSKLQDYAKSQGFKFREGTDILGNGKTKFGQNNPTEIIIKSTMSKEGKIKTLAHEIGHAKLHDPKHGYRPDSRSVRELEAESIGHMVAGKYGIKTDNYSYTYINGWMQKEGVSKSNIDSSFPKSLSVYNDVINYVGEQ